MDEQSGEATAGCIYMNRAVRPWMLNRAVRRPLMHVQMDEDHFSTPSEKQSAAHEVPPSVELAARSLPFPLAFPLPLPLRE